MVKSSQEWCEELGIHILDPDGWDRSNFSESWSELIDLEEFNRRIVKSTLYILTPLV